MAPNIPSSSTNISLTPSVAFITKKTNFITNCSIPRKLNKQTSSTQNYALPLSPSIRLLPQFWTGCILKPKLKNTFTLSATETDVVALEEANSTPKENEPSETSVEPSATSNATPDKAKRSRPARKSDFLPVKNEELLPGAKFTGKVRSIQPFGAFVDFGAFTDGLVHVSQLSNSFVKDVNSVVTVGQEVTVRLVEVNMVTGRISLTMRDSDDVSSDNSRPPRKMGQKKNDMNKKSSKFVKGQDLEGTVKNLTRAGAFISLPEGEEGFLPQSEEADEGFAHVMGGSSLEVGQEVSVRVLRVARGQLTLTMKKEEDGGKLDEKLSQGVVHTATNPFVLAFRSNKDISAFLDEQVEKTEEIEGSSDIVEDGGIPSSEDESTEEIHPVEDQENVFEASSEIAEEVKDSIVYDVIVEDEEESQPEGSVDAKVADDVIVKDEEESQPKASVDAKVADDVIVKDEEESQPKASVDAKVADDVVVKDEEQSQPEDSVDAKVADDVIVKDEEQSQPEASVDAEVADDVIVKDEGQSEETDTVESSSSPLEENQVIGEVSEVLGDDVAVTEQSSDASPVETTTKAAISPALVKQLRDETGAGMMDCKKALSQTEGDILKAQEYLRKKGLASADKKASRATSQGRIGSYIHDSRIGVLIELNCETDFVARGDIFKELVEDLAMQVAACPLVQYLDTEEVPKEIVDKEKEIEMQKEDLLSKPEQIRSKIVDGRIRKRLEEVALLEQPFIKDDKIVVKDWVKQTISTIGENIKVKRFVRYNLGEGLEKKSQDFAAEVAAQTAGKAAHASVNQEPTAVTAEIKESVEIPPKATVSAALVKQLREETGAGMMDCKKALSETGGDLEKAQEYLRKKGLSSADKKSSRLAAEGRIGSYIHDSRIGVLIEVNCETDFVGRSQNFKELVDDLAMQVVASPQVQYVSIEDIPEGIVEKEKQLEMQREDIQSKPENIREKIVEGRVTKRLGELALLEQPFIKSDNLLVKDLVKQTVAALGENIKVRRFVRFTLGENIENEA